MSKYPELEAAFYKLRMQGVDDTQIRLDARAQGWTDEEITDALSGITDLERPQEVVQHQSLAPQTTSVQEQRVESPRSGGAIKKVLFILFFLLLVGGIVGAIGYAYYTGFNPFAKAPYNEANFSSQLLAKLESIESGESKIRIAAYTEARNEDAKPFVLAFEGREEMIKKYERDVERADIAGDILSEFFYTGLEMYPVSLDAYRAQADPNSSLAIRGFKPDPLTKQPFVYRQTEGGLNFELEVTFETDEAIAQIKDGFLFDLTKARITNKTVVFTKESSPYVFISSTPPKTFFEEIQEVMSYLSSDFSVSGEIVALRGKSQEGEEDASGSLQVDLKGDLDDLTYHVNAEVRVIDETFYFIVNNLPGLLSGFIPKNQWIEWSPGEELGYFDVEAVEEGWSTSQEAYDAYKNLVVRLADETRLFVFKNEPVRERKEGTIVYRYDLTLRKEAMVPFYTALLEETQNNEAYSEYRSLVNEEGLALLTSNAFDTIFEYFQSNVSISVFVDQEGMPSEILTRIRVVPDDKNEAMKERQMIVELSSSFDRVNEDITIEIPKDTKSFEEALEGVMGSLGAAQELGSDAAIKANMNNLRVQIEIFGSQIDGTVNYEGSCEDASVQMIFESITEKSGRPYCLASAQRWVVAAPLTTEGYVCADSTGYFEEYTDADMLHSGEICP